MTLNTKLILESNVYISGNLTVKGNVFVVDTQHLIVDDPVIELGANTVGTPTLDTGVLMNRGNLANAFMGFDESQDEFVMGLTSDPSSVTTINLSSYAPLQVGPLYTNYSANLAGNTSISRSLAVGYTDQRVPQANLDVKGNVYIDGNTHDTGPTKYFFWQWERLTRFITTAHIVILIGRWYRTNLS